MRASVFALVVLAHAAYAHAFSVIDADTRQAIDPSQAAVGLACKLANTNIQYWIDRRSIPQNLCSRAVGADCTDSMALGRIRQAVGQAANVWEKVGGLEQPVVFAEAPAAPQPLLQKGDPTVVISWEPTQVNSFGLRALVNLEFADCSPTGEWPRGDIYLDATETWALNPSDPGLYLPVVLAHELGHILGLHHSRNQAAMMWEKETGIQQFKARIVLRGDDVNGLRFLYAANAAPAISGVSVGSLTLTPGQVTAFQVIASDADGDTLQFRWRTGAGKAVSGCTRAASTCTWKAPSRSGYFRVWVGVKDTRHSFFVEREIWLTVGVPNTTLVQIEI